MQANSSKSEETEKDFLPTLCSLCWVVVNRVLEMDRKGNGEGEALAGLLSNPEFTPGGKLAIYVKSYKEMTCLCCRKSEYFNPEQQFVYSRRLISTLHRLAVNKLTLDYTITVLAVFIADNYMVHTIFNVVL